MVDKKTIELWEERISKNQCPQCGTPLVPDSEAKVFGTDKWDEHTFKFGCDCVEDKNIRISIG